jgi:hypothetical protein
VRRDDRSSDAQLCRHEKEIQALKDAFTRLNKENAVRLREQAELAARVAALDAAQAKQAPLTADCGALKGQQLRLDSLTAEMEQLKAGLIKNAILPERILVPGANPFNGIINCLTRECGGNVADQGTVKITASSVFDDCYLPRNAANLPPGSIFQSKTEPNQWIEWDFKSAQIEATHYSIFTHGDASGGRHLRHWVLEGRNADEEWMVLDERRDDSQLNGNCRRVTFEIKTRLRVRVIRLRQTGVNHEGDHRLAFGAVEFFGRFFRPSSAN